MKIAVDAMGGDNAPAGVVAGALRAASEVEQLVLVGPYQQLETLLPPSAHLPENLRIHPSGPALSMSDRPVRTLKRSPDASIRVAVELAARGEVDAVVSAGHTGGVVAAASLYLKRIKGLRRAAMAVNLPTMRGGSCTLLDVGATVKCRPLHLFQFAVMGASYVRTSRGVASPRVGLLNMGREAGKGSEVVQKAGALLESSGLAYAGFVEGEALFSGELDVVVCDGFVGNVLLKASEGLVASALRFMADEAERSGQREQAAPILGRFRELTDYAEYGGAPLLGVETLCLVCHGKSDERAIASAVGAAARLSDLTERLRHDLERNRAGRFNR